MFIYAVTATLYAYNGPDVMHIVTATAAFEAENAIRRLYDGHTICNVTSRELGPA